MECLGSDHGWEPETQQRPAVRRWPAHGGPRTAPTELFGEARNRRTLTVDDHFPAESDPQGPLCAIRERQAPPCRGRHPRASGACPSGDGHRRRESSDLRLPSLPAYRSHRPPGGHAVEADRRPVVRYRVTRPDGGFAVRVRAREVTTWRDGGRGSGQARRG